MGPFRDQTRYVSFKLQDHCSVPCVSELCPTWLSQGQLVRDRAAAPRSILHSVPGKETWRFYVRFMCSSARLHPEPPVDSGLVSYR